ncbi:MAG TPA: DUF692 domain-containing protein [Thermoanaerobaculia bacterium]
MRQQLLRRWLRWRRLRRVRLVRYGLGWRAELGAGILANLDRVDVVEVMAEELFDADRGKRRALQFLRSHVPVVLHATSLGLASTEAVDARRLDAVARVIDWLQPEVWSEHLAFVRAGGAEVGHLAAPPRNDATLAGLVRNVETARRATGSLPCLENVASLVEPPLSTYGEGAWLHAVVRATGCELLLDLHNLHANATNFGFDAAAVVRSLPAPRLIHLAGGRRIERNRLLDDHLHAVPPEVYELLAVVDAPEAMVILERDGNYPAIDELVGELDRARAVRHRASGAGLPGCAAEPATSPGRPMPDAIPFLATLYTNDAARARFTADPQREAALAGLPAEVAELDLDDLRVAAHSFAHKRERQS